MKQSILDEIKENNFSIQKLAASCPELRALKDVPQNPDYHGEGDVLRHTEMVCEELTGLVSWQLLPDKEKTLLFLAAAFHDIGKAACTKQEEGKWVSPKHTIVGEKIFRRIAYREEERFGLTFSQRELVAKLIRYHGLPLWFLNKKQPEQELCKGAESIPLKLLYLLSKADALGRQETLPGGLPDRVELFGEYARELDIWEHPYAFANPYTKFQFFQKEDMWQGAQLYDDTSFDVLMMAGLPLSGKDTWIAQKAGKWSLEGRTPVISLDELREKMGIPPTKASGKVVQEALELARGYLRRKQPFIWNATNLLQETRQKLVRLFAGYGARVHILYLEVPYQELLRRNGIRERHIPEGVLEEMIRKLEIPAPWEAYQVTLPLIGDGLEQETLILLDN